MADPKKRGRPRLDPTATRQPLTMRTRRGLRSALEVAASANSRTLSQEIEARLEMSFLADDLRQIIREEMQARPVAMQAPQTVGLASTHYSCARHGWRAFGSACPACAVADYPPRFNQ